MTDRTFPALGDTPALRAAIAAALMLVTVPAGYGQGLQSEETIDQIVGTEIAEEEAAVAADPGRVLTAIETAAQSAAAVRKVATLDKVDIVFLADAAVTEGGLPPEIAETVTKNQDAVDELRREIEGNAMLYHAVNSRGVLMRDVLGVEFDDAKGAVIFAAAKPPAE